jgi:hypothetical protein
VHACLPHAQNIEHFAAMLERKGITCSIKTDPAGKVTGVLFIDRPSRCVMNSSEIKGFRLSDINELKNNATLKENDSSKRNEQQQTKKSSASRKIMYLPFAVLRPLFLATEGPASFWAMISGAGFTLGTNDGEAITLTGATNEMNSIIDAAGKIWFDKNVTTMPEDFTPMDYYSSIRIFCEGRSLFMLSFPSDFDQTVTGGLNDSCKFEFGVMPFPKYDSEQERYYNAMNVHNASIFAIPYTVADPAQVGFYLEAISEESVGTSYPAFIESKCMIQDSYDELTARMLSLSFDSITYDVVTLLNPGGIFEIVTSQIPTFRTNIFIRLYNSKGDKPQIALDEYVNNFEGIE